MANTCALYNYVCWGWLGTSLCTCGFLLSCLAFYSFLPVNGAASSSPTSCSSRLILRSLALVDAVLLVSVLVTDCVPYICSYTGSCRSPWHTWPYVRYVWSVTPTSHLAGAWLVVLIAANRYTAVCRPHALEKSWSPTRTAMGVATVLAGAVLYNVPRLLEYHVVRVQNPCEVNTTVLVERANAFADRKWYSVGYKAVLTSVVLIAGPLLLQVTFTLAVVRRLTRKKGLSAGTVTARGAKRVGGMTRMLMSVVGVAIMCQLPLGVYQIARAVSSPSRSCDNALYWLDTVSKLAVNANPSLNFAVYYCMSPPFRKSLQALWCLDSLVPGSTPRGTYAATESRGEVGVSKTTQSPTSNHAPIGQHVDSDDSSSTCFSCSK